MQWIFSGLRWWVCRDGRFVGLWVCCDGGFVGFSMVVCSGLSMDCGGGFAVSDFLFFIFYFILFFFHFTLLQTL